MRKNVVIMVDLRTFCRFTLWTLIWTMNQTNVFGKKRVATIKNPVNDCRCVTIDFVPIFLLDVLNVNNDRMCLHIGLITKRN